MTSVTVTSPLPMCPDKKLITSETIYSGSLHIDQTMCLDKTILFNDADIRNQCTFPKTYDQCSDEIRSKSILNALTAQTIGSCGNIQVLAEEVQFCSKGMDSLTNSVIQNSSVPKEAQTTARIIRQTCKFDSAN